MKDLRIGIYELDYEMLRQAQHDKIVGMFGVDGYADLKDLKDLQFGIYELRLDYEMLRQAQHDKIVGMFGVDGYADLKDLKGFAGFERILNFQFGLFETLSR